MTGPDDDLDDAPAAPLWPFLAWSPDDAAGVVHDVTVDGVWDQLLAFYGGAEPAAPLRRIVELAREHGVVSVVVERRYIDHDWRSEHGAFHSKLFRRHPSVCHRWHLFTTAVDDQVTHLDPGSYRGYVVMRPLTSTPVGRAMITPPPGLDGALRCEADERVSLFGHVLGVRAMPFLSQDAEYLRCAHATLWMVLRHAHLAHGIPRALTAQVHDATLGGMIVGRQLPSEGLSVSQMLAGATTLGLSPGLMPLPEQRADSDDLLGLHAILCRYVNSQMPPIIVSQRHAWVVVAYHRAPDGRLTLWRHDDARGPYIRVDDPWDEPDDAHRPWTTAILPLLPAVYLTAERAERAGREWFARYVAEDARPDEPIARAVAADALTYRTYVLPSADFVEGLAGRGLPSALVDLYRLSVLPEHVWVVEAVDRTARREGRPDVMGEALIDATAPTHEGPLLTGLVALHGGRLAHRIGPDHGSRREIRLAEPGHYPTGRRHRR